MFQIIRKFAFISALVKMFVSALVKMFISALVKMFANQICENIEIQFDNFGGSVICLTTFFGV